MNTPMNREEILAEIKTSLHEMFEIDPDDVVETARLREDLDLDSIDAIDLAVKLKNLLGRRVELAVLKELRTVSNVLDLIESELPKAPASETPPSQSLEESKDA